MDFPGTILRAVTDHPERLRLVPGHAMTTTSGFLGGIYADDASGTWLDVFLRFYISELTDYHPPYVAWNQDALAGFDGFRIKLSGTWAGNPVEHDLHPAAVPEVRAVAMLMLSRLWAILIKHRLAPDDREPWDQLVRKLQQDFLGAQPLAFAGHDSTALVVNTDTQKVLERTSHGPRLRLVLERIGLHNIWRTSCVQIEVENGWQEVHWHPPGLGDDALTAQTAPKNCGHRQAGLSY